MNAGLGGQVRVWMRKPHLCLVVNTLLRCEVTPLPRAPARQVPVPPTTPIPRLQDTLRCPAALPVCAAAFRSPSTTSQV